jgi:hypothetical protein
MNLLIHTVRKEKQRIDRMLDAYTKQLDGLPKGSVTEKKSGQNIYYYLKYRVGRRVVSEYLGKDETKINQIRALLDKRRHVKAMIKSLREEQALALRILEG